MSSLFHRSLSADLPVVAHGRGSVLIDTHGKQYLDACGGAAVSCLGHSHARVGDAIKAQLDQLAFAHSGFFTNQPAEELAAWLMQRAPPGFGAGRAMFLGSGSEAMEAALKLARQYHLERGDARRDTIIAREFSYHGNTLGALAVSGHTGRRQPYAPMLMPVRHVMPCYAYRHRAEDETEAAYGLRAANALEREILACGAQRVAAFVAEPVVGATLGSVPAVAGYFRRIRDLCDHYGVLLIADEVMCGMGRCGSWFALERDGIAPDLITLAKGLGAGYQPISAVMASAEVCAAVQSGSGVLWNGHTYMSHVVACAGALAVLGTIESEDLLSAVNRQGDALQSALRERFGAHPQVGDIRGRGLLWSLELVANKASKTPFEARCNLAARIKTSALEHGLLCYPSAGCVDGRRGDHILLAPPYNVTTDELNQMVDALARTLSACLAEH